VTNKSITVLTTTDFITQSGTVTTNSFTPTNKSSTVMEIDIVIQESYGNRHTLLLLCANFGDNHLYLIGTILRKFKWMVEQSVD
jgi:hypothetical protein